MQKGISSILAVVLLISIAIIGGVAVYLFMGGVITTEPTTDDPEAISIAPMGEASSSS